MEQNEVFEGSYSQVWECDYGRRSDFFKALNEINNTFKENLLQGMNVMWSDIPYDLRLFACFYYSGSEEEIAELDSSLKNILVSTGAVQRSDYTGDSLMESLAGRQLNMVTCVKGLTISDPCKFEEIDRLESKGYKVGLLEPENKIFLSHQSERKDKIRDLQRALSSNGISTWFDEIDIEYGDNIASAISRGVNQSKVVIFWISDKFLQSNWCRYEFERFHTNYASTSDVAIISLVESDCKDKVPEFISTLKYYEVSGAESIDEISRKIIPAIRKATSTKGSSGKYWTE